MHTISKTYHLGGKSTYVTGVKLVGNGMWYRVLVGSFLSLQDAVAFCRQARESGAACEVLTTGANRAVPASKRAHRRAGGGCSASKGCRR
jgi:hypothetical protein